jgi:hypothetical protein
MRSAYLSREMRPREGAHADPDSFCGSAKDYREDTKQNFPLSEADYKQALSAECMVANRKGVNRALSVAKCSSF